MRFAVALVELPVGVLDEEGFDLPQKIPGADWFDEQRVGIFSGPIFAVFEALARTFFGRWKSGQ